MNQLNQPQVNHHLLEKEKWADTWPLRLSPIMFVQKQDDED